MNNYRFRKALTLIEMMVVVGILAIIASVLIISLNPSEILKRGRDTKRIFGIEAVDMAIAIHINERVSNTIGNPFTVYTSIPDPTATTTVGTDCSTLGLPKLPTGWSWHCAGPDTYRNINGTGWIPVNFEEIAGGSPLEVLPIDPINTTSSRQYYTYTADEGWVLATPMESISYKVGGKNDKTGTDGGENVHLFERGTNIALLPIDYGDSALVGWWKLGEGSGITTFDGSGTGNNGTLSNGPAWQSPQSCKWGACLSFDGANDYVDIPNSPSLQVTQDLSILIWVKPIFGPDRQIVFAKSKYEEFQFGFIPATSDNAPFYIRMKHGDGTGINISSFDSFILITEGEWQHIASVRDDDTRVYHRYKDGVPAGPAMPKYSIAPSAGVYGVSIGARYAPNAPLQHEQFFNGLIDEVRIYNRTLSATEVNAIYNATPPL